MKIFKVLLITLMLLANTAFAAEFSAQVKTSEGIVQGVYDEKYNVVKWFGIPYAQQADGENAGHCRRKQRNIPVLKIVHNMLLPICNLTAKM